jgi:bifunctional non-homologous end joining protein LigD
MSGMPDWLEPMAATLTQDRFTGPEWIFERKYDGIRLLAFKQGHDVRLFSRNRLRQNQPRLEDAIRKLPVDDIVLDGEVTWDPSTRDETSARSGRVGPGYHVFDVLWLGGRNVTKLPLEERRELLARLPLRFPLLRVEELREAEPWTRACAEGWEGVIAKRRGSVYEHKRSKNWLKMKCELTRDFIVGGFTDPQGSRVGLGALLVGHHDQGDFAFAGKIGTGFDTRLLLSLRARLDAIEIGASPFTRAKGLPRLRAHWVRPEIVVTAAFIEWTGHGKLRHPRLLGVKA